MTFGYIHVRYVWVLLYGRWKIDILNSFVILRFRRKSLYWTSTLLCANSSVFHLLTKQVINPLHTICLFRSFPEKDDGEENRPQCPSVHQHFCLILMKLGTWVEVDEWCTTVNIFSTVKVKVTRSEMSNMVPRQIAKLGHDQRKQMEVSISWLLGTFFKAWRIFDFVPKAWPWHRTQASWPNKKSEMTVSPTRG